MGCRVTSGCPVFLSLGIALDMTLQEFSSPLHFPLAKATVVKKRETGSPVQSVARFGSSHWKQNTRKWFCTWLNLVLSGSVAAGGEMQRSKTAEGCKAHRANQISVLTSWAHEHWAWIPFCHPYSLCDIGLWLPDFVLGERLYFYHLYQT